MSTKRYPDEVRNPNEMREAMLSEFVGDPESLRRKFDDLVAKSDGGRARIAELEEQLARAKKRTERQKREIANLESKLGRSLSSLEAYRVESARLKREIQRVRASTSMRVGRTVLKPLQEIVKLRSAVRHAPEKGTMLGKPDNGPSPVAGAPRGTENPPRRLKGDEEASPTSVPGTRRSLEELLKDLEEDPNASRLYAALARLWFTAGEIARPAEMVEAHQDIIAGGEPRLKALAATIQSAAHVARHGIVVPGRGTGTAYRAERGRLMYCVHSTPIYSSNGYSIRTKGVADGLSRNGVDITVVARTGYPWDSKYTGVSERTQSTLDGVDYVHNPGLSLNDATLLQAIDEAADAFVREARRLRVSTIHAASNYYTGLAALIAARRVGVPFVYEVRGLWEVTQASTSTGWDMSERYALQVSLESLVAAESDAILAITPQVAEELVRRGADRDKITVMPNAVDSDAIVPLPKDTSFAKKLKISADEPWIGFAGSMVPYEGLLDLIEAAKVLRERGLAFQVVLAGSGSQEKELKERVLDLGLDDTVHFLGRVAYKEMPRLLSLFDIMPCPRVSLPVTEMVSPLKPLEAFAAGKAVLLSDVAPHRDLAGHDQERAAVFKAGDVQDLADKLAILIADAEKRRQLGRTARLWTIKERQWTATCTGAISAYRQAREGYAKNSRSENLHVRDLEIGLIADEFTTKSLQGSIGVRLLSRANWAHELEGLSFVLIESAWKGNDAQWYRGVGRYSDDEHRDIQGLIETCRRLAIPTVFWNKEDPVHTSRFLETARLCDHIFTVDANLIPLYRSAAGESTKTVSSMPFFAQPRIHSPLDRGESSEPTVAYAGTYYGDRYAERTSDLHRLLSASKQTGLAIYDRQSIDPDSPYKFPAEFREAVRGGLSYDSVLEKYRTHVAHLNVNSVRDSPTMYSRRVVEIAASGGVVLSGPGRGVQETLGGAIACSGSLEDSQALLSYWSTDLNVRRREAWHQMRSILRVHVADFALAIIARTAGFPVHVEKFDSYALVADELTDELVATLIDQSVPPAAIVVRGRQQVSQLKRDKLTSAGIGIETEIDESVLAGVKWLGLAEEALPRTWYEDMLIVAQSGNWERLLPVHVIGRDQSFALARKGPNDVVTASGLVLSERTGHFENLESALRGTFAKTLSLLLPHVAEVDSQMREDGEALEVSIPGSCPETVLVAGHDLKFLRSAIDGFRSHGFEVLVDEWTNHTDHDEARSRTLLESADIVFCEWGLGNAVWYSHQVTSHQRLVVRVHLQEIYGPHLRNIHCDNVDQFIFVNEVVRLAAVASHGIPAEKTTVVPNYVLTESLSRAKTPEAAKRIGLVGIIPQRKRLDLALDLLEELHRVDPSYTLSIKGSLPKDYSWMAARKDEMDYFDQQFERIEALNEACPGAVELAGYGEDMGEWYSTIGTVISVSDFESFHLTIADGAASGALPVILYWPGAEAVYPLTWSHATVASMAVRILEGGAGDEVPEYIGSHYSLEKVLPQLVGTLVSSGRQLS
ncbi:glycosyltransferase [Oerskovia sp. USHLN155]|uniref:glycosyltransferase n=1 Tax=Oerskovia sp. USHLN155 TaxID=3081288 RepID=UPI0030158D9C